MKYKRPPISGVPQALLKAAQLVYAICCCRAIGSVPCARAGALARPSRANSAAANFFMAIIAEPHPHAPWPSSPAHRAALQPCGHRRGFGSLLLGPDLLGGSARLRRP